MIKVLQVFNRLDQGGIEHFVINLMTHMDLSQIEFHFAMMSGEKGVLDNFVKKHGGRIHYFSSDEKSLKNVKLNLEKIINEYGPFQVIHSHVYFFSGYILRIAKGIGVPIRIAHAHDVYKGENASFKRTAYEYVMKKMINRYSTYKLGVSMEACIHVFGRVDDHTFIVNNAIDLKQYVFNSKIRREERSELGVSSKECLLINIGRFEDQKDHNYLIDVFSQLLKFNTEYKLILVGKGSLKDKIKKKVKNLAITDKVIFLENRNDINKLLMASDIFVLPSKYEGLPIVLVEAQATGLPCIVSNNITERVHLLNNYYELKKKGNYKEWVRLIVKLRNKQRITNQQELYNAGFSIEQVAREMKSFYLGLK